MREKGKRIWKSCVAVALVISMVLGTSGTVLAASLSNIVKDGGDGTINYVSLGASQTNGYGLRYYLDEKVYEDPTSFDKATANVYGYHRAPEAAYPNLVKQALADSLRKEVELEQLAISSMRAEELHMLLDNEYYGDAYTAWRFYDSQGNGWFAQAEKGGLTALRAAYQDAVKNADLVTVDIGVNNFGVYAINRITGNSYDADLTKVFDEATLERYQAIKAYVLDMLMEEMGEGSAVSREYLEFIADTFAYALVGFMKNFDASVGKIYELNPDTKVVVLSIPNMMDGLYTAYNGTEIPLGEIYGKVVDIANMYVAALSPYAENYYYANTAANGHAETFLEEIKNYDGNPDSISQNMKDCFDIYDDDLHLRIKLQAILGENESDTYKKALNTAYDVVATIMQKAASGNVIDMSVLAGDNSAAEDQLLAYIEKSVMDAVTAVVSGQAYDFQLDETLFNNPAIASVATMGVRFSIGNSFFAHPSENGHAEIEEAIIYALENEVMGSEVVFADIIEATTYEYTPDEDSYYVSIGDSSVTGIRLKGHSENGFQTKVAESFGYKLAEELGLNVKNQYMQLGIDGLRAEDIRYILDENFVPDQYTMKKVIPELEDYDMELEDTRAIFKKEIAKADFITVGFGNNNLTSFVTEQLLRSFSGKKTYEMDWTRYVSEEDMPNIEAAKKELEQTIIDNGMGEFSDLLMLAVESYAYGYVGLVCNYAEVINMICEINPDAEIIIVGMYNPLEGVTLSDQGDEIDLGEYVNYLVELTNMHFLSYAMMNPQANVVMAPDVETFMETSSSEENDAMGIEEYLMEMIKNKGVDMYASANGHTYIKDQILGARVLPEIPAGLLGDVNNDDSVDIFDVQTLFDHVMGTEEITDANVLARADVNGDGSVDIFDVQTLFDGVMGA